VCACVHSVGLFPVACLKKRAQPLEDAQIPWPLRWKLWPDLRGHVSQPAVDTLKATKGTFRARDASKQFNAGDYACAAMRYNVLLLLFLFHMTLTGPFVFFRDY
jgi:hypothetical protein